MVVKVLAGAIKGVTEFSWVSPNYAGGIHVIKFLFVFLLNLSYYINLIIGSAEDPRREEEKIFQSLHKQKYRNSI